MSSSPILVTWDFTLLSEFALEHAVRIAKMLNNPIQLIHILEKKTDQQALTEKLQQVACDAEKKYGILPGIILKEGSIFTTISEVANHIQANLVVMGTHGIQGIQKITGSWALKVIVGSAVPFLVVQAPPSNLYLKKIVFPIDFQNESKEKLPWIIYLAQYYRSEILVYKNNFQDERLKMKVNSNLIFLRKALDAKNINYTVHTNETKLPFAEAAIEFSRQTNSDLIAIMTTKNIGFKDYVFGAVEQKIIANPYKIPVICVNPRDDLYKLGGFSR
ncbi:MAG TPA: universal stress protein [Salinivirgaceae bacterium]|nr:universal stress protein [Salinivirgaceae bacterium]